MDTSKGQIAGNDLCRLIHLHTVFSFVLNFLTNIYLNIDENKVLIRKAWQTEMVAKELKHALS